MNLILVLYLAFFLVWLIPLVIAFNRLRQRDFDETAKAMWVLVIVLIPLIGPLAFMTLSGSKEERKSG